ncbi:hypothetical protein GCM10008927_16260 [Amylibacter ulvae]|uniref:Cadherin domain-containing protein n=1 Tax=Paramylibacter ulvae TaxID=1651968 RepID=A0ABQ3D109_9RHOB|nr:ExeM/NucH family extracellular endonuclease [Amylibacter ulvae]GHA51587.1 hypothetical protein GCM10008927_16260 [Amylibacter ulvae]
MHFRHFWQSHIFGNSSSNTLIGTERSEHFYGFGGDDTIIGGGGNDRIFGGRGSDTVQLNGSIADYDIINRGGWWNPITRVVQRDENGHVESVTRLHSVESLYFAGDDYTYHLDGTNNAALAGDDTASVSEDDVLTLDVDDLLANDQEFDGDTLSITAVSATSDAGAVVTLANGMVSYDAGDMFDSLGAGDTATDTFTYTVDEGQGGADTATVTVTITGVNDGPVIVSADAFTIDENQSGAVASVFATDVDGDGVTYAIIGGADAANFAIDAQTGELIFVAPQDFENPADADLDNVYEVSVSATDDMGAVTTQDITTTVTDVDETPSVDARINEIHYDNAGADEGEFFEIRTNAGDDVSTLVVELYNGSNGTVYQTVQVSDLTMTTDGTFDYYVWDAGSIQNGSPDGIALSNDGAVVEFLSYEGTLTAVGGSADGMTSTDIGQSETSSTAIGDSLQRDEDGVWEAPRANTQGGSNDAIVTPTLDARINEIHYDNAGADQGEFFEIRTNAGDDVSTLVVELYNGSNGTVYQTVQVSDLTMTTDGTFDYYVWDAGSIQNGSPDGIALSNDGTLVEFLSYEGTLTAVGGFADGVTSTDIGQSEPSDTAIGDSLQRNEDGTWDAPRTNSAGGDNGGATIPAVVINELAVSTTGTDWEFVELAGVAGTSLDGFALLQLDATGEVISAIDLNGQSIGENGYFLASSDQAEATFGVTGNVTFADNTLNNETSSFLLVDGYDGITTSGDLDTDDDGALDSQPFASVVDSVALIDGDAGLVYSDNVVGPDGAFLPAGAVRSPEIIGEFEATDFADSAGYTPTAGDVINPEPTEATLISTIQGAGDASFMVGEYVLVSAIVTYVVSDGFYLQEEDADVDADVNTSEGLFIFTGGAPLVVAGDLVETIGTVTEFNGLTEMNNVTSTIVLSSDNTIPTAAQVQLSGSASDFEAVEGMHVSVTSGNGEALTVIENFNLDRFGEITISAGVQTQPTQIFDAQTQGDEIAQLQEENANNTLLIDDGVSAQNPDEFQYIPNTTGDNGNGYLDSGDTFDVGSSTIRLGSEITEPIDGVMTYGFGDYRLLVNGTLAIDEDTNTGARDESPDDVGGNIQVASFNVLNYFTTFTGQGGSGPNNLSPRGASNQEEFDRQSENIVNAMSGTGAEVFALQELENNGFDAGSAISTLVSELNIEAGATGSDAIYAFVDPTNGAVDGFVGNDAITTGIVYDSNAVTLVTSDYLEFAEDSNAATYALAEFLNQYVSSSNQLDDLGRNRPAVAATFADNETGETFTIVSTHFKSKGDSGLQNLADAVQAALDAGTIPADEVDAVTDGLAALLADPNFDQGDGQGFWNGVRTDAANEVVDWMENSYAGTSTDGDYLIMGDFNAYGMEDPVQAVRDDAGLADLIDQFIGQEDAYSYVFDGQRGTLDQAFASNSMADQVTGVTEWHINADEPDLLGYDSDFNNPAFYSDDVFAASDHDPLIIGLDLGDQVIG